MTGVDPVAAALPLAAPTSRVRAPSWSKAATALNCDTIPSLESLRGRVVLLGFWSASGVHCAHLLEELGEIHARFSEGLTVIGVHVPKFERERDAGVARRALSRLRIRHAALHDPDFGLWQSYDIRSWPTVVAIDARGRVAAKVQGDGQLDRLSALAQRLLDEAAAEGVRGFETAPEFPLAQMRSTLAFPARVAVDASRLYVADSGHHRVLECDHEGHVLRTFGNGSPALRDGRGDDACLHTPHGIALGPGVLYVADSGNHAIRVVQLGDGQVDTLAGSGVRAPMTSVRIDRPLEARLNSPFDLSLRQGALYVAMAGNHQVWRMDLPGGTLSLLTGTGRMGGADGPLAGASFAQPSGLAGLGGEVFVADADGSALRAISVDGRREVRTLVGAGQFVFGAVDGQRSDARMQFPQGLCADRERGRILVADRYNDAIRILHPASGELRTLAVPHPLVEPCGVAFDAGVLWIANSGAHEVVRFDPRSATASRIAVGE